MNVQIYKIHVYCRNFSRRKSHANHAQCVDRVYRAEAQRRRGTEGAEAQRGRERWDI